MVLLCLKGPAVLADGGVEAVPLEECRSIFSAHISGSPIRCLLSPTFWILVAINFSGEMHAPSVQNMGPVIQSEGIPWVTIFTFSYFITNNWLQ